jgi:acetyl esterase/lipase
MVSREARAEIDRMLASRGVATEPAVAKSLDDERREWEEAARDAALPAGARFQDVDIGIPAEWMDAPGVVDGRVFLLLHGGGYSSGSPVTHRKLAANLARASRARVLTPAYRLAPEHPFPAGVDDAVAAYRWLVMQGTKPANIIMGGDSAGGGLAVSTLLALRDAGAAMPRAAVLMSAWTDLTASSPSHDTLRDVDVQVTRDDLRGAGRLYMGGGDPADPRASTLFANLAGLPPLLIQVVVYDNLLYECRIK